MMARRTVLTLAASLAFNSPVAAQRPWLTADVRAGHDTQERTALEAAAQYGGYLQPNLTLAIDVGGHRITAPDVTTTGALVGLAATVGIPAARMGITAAGGIVAGGPQTLLEPSYRIGAHYDAGAGRRLRAAASRDRYTATVASLDMMLMVNAVELSLDRSGDPGWAGELLGRRETYGDGNAVSTAYGWLLAPLSRSRTHSLRAGYAAAWQDAPESRWTPHPDGGGPPHAEGQQAEGRYSPYYTPHDVRTHSALINAALAVGSGWLLADGSLGVYARETAPVLIRSARPPPGFPGDVILTPPGHLRAWLHFYERSFTPYRAALSLVTPAGDHTSVTVGAELSSTAFYRAGTLRLAVARSL
jgi:hypothetical protein